MMLKIFTTQLYIKLKLIELRMFDEYYILALN